MGILPRAGGNSTFSKPVSAAYEKAVQVLSDERLRQACRILLQEPDEDYEKIEPDSQPTEGDTETKETLGAKQDVKDSESERTGKSAEQQLLDYYKECQAAVKVIQKEAPSDLFKAPPAMPLSRNTTAGAARPHAKPLLNAKLAMKSSASGTALQRGKRIRRPDNKVMRMTGSRTNLATPQSAAGSTPNSSSPSTNEGTQQPPPEALQFLAKLNQDATRQTPQPAAARKSPPPPPPPFQQPESSKTKHNAKSDTLELLQEEEEEEGESTGHVHEEGDGDDQKDEKGEDKRKDNDTDTSTKNTGRPKRPRADSISSPDRRVQPRRTARH